MNTNLKTCVSCLMDTTDPKITFNEAGECNYCVEASAELPKYRYTKEQVKANIESLVNHVKSKKQGKYDCLVGISGGVDSSYVTHLAAQWGLNPLVVHFDNGWNSELAVSNINNILNKTGFDFQTYVIDWEEFRDLQRAFLKASVVDIEMLTDHAIKASMFKLARENNIKCVLSGTNYATEHGLPTSWVWHKGDLQNIKAIQKLYGNKALKSFPTIGPFKSIFYKMIYKLDYLEPLNLINFRKLEAMKVLEQEYDWRYYGGKHYESLFTKFYQAHILPEKFNIDKRKSHISALVRNNEISLDEARKQLAQPLYQSESEFQDEKEFVLKKLGFSAAEFDEILQDSPKAHDSYPTDIHVYHRLNKVRTKFNL